MQEIVDYEADYEKMKRGEKDLVYTNIMGMKPDMSGPEVGQLNLPVTEIHISSPDKNTFLANGAAHQSSDSACDKEEVSDDEESGSESEGDSEDDEEDRRKAGRPKHETAEEKRVSKI